MCELNRSISNKGFSLVELMVALTIGLFIMASVVQVFLGFSRGYSFHYNVSNVGDNMRFMMSEIFYHDIRMSGYPGCLTSKPIIHLDTSSEDYHPAKHGEIQLWAWEYEGTGQTDTVDLPEKPMPGGSSSSWKNFLLSGLPSELSGLVVPNTDVLVVASASDTEIQLADPIVESEQKVDTTKATDLPDNAILTVYNENCGFAEVFQNGFGGTASRIGIASGSGVPGNVAGARFKEGYTQNAKILALHSTAYYIGRPDGADRVSLMAKRIDIPGAEPEEMIPNVENLQLLFGFTTGLDRKVDSYVTADAVEDWSQVNSVRIGVVARSTQGMLLGKKKSLSLLGLNFNLPDDGRVRFESSITVARRNLGF